MPEVPDVSAIVQNVKARIKQIEDQLKDNQRLTDELERLRDALSRLEGAARSRVSAGPRGRRPAAKAAPPAKRASTTKRAATIKGASAATAASPAKRASSAKPASARAGAPRGQNKAKVLDALKGGGPMTASEIAKVTGISAGTASTLLNKMAKTGELAKAERGYTLPRQPAAAPTTPAARQ
jgi:CRP-like cAMP-binding protein